MITDLTGLERLNVLRHLEQQRLVRSKTVGEYTIYKYHARVFYDNLWHMNELLLDSRGLVLDQKGEIVVLPFRKVFNHGEQKNVTIHRDENVSVVEKVNGFLGVISVIKKDNTVELVHSTTGSLDSDFVTLLKNYSSGVDAILKKQQFVGHTFMFEVCVPEDPHIIPENSGLYLIGCRIHSDGYTYSEEELDHLYLAFSKVARRPKVRHFECFGDVVKASKTEKIEGFMCYTDEVSLKVKTTYYLVNKFLARSKKTDIFWDNRNKAREFVDEEFYPLIDYLTSILTKEQWKELTEQQKLETIREFFDERKNSINAVKVAND